jgi:hypothetical protein
VAQNFHSQNKEFLYPINPNNIHNVYNLIALTIRIPNNPNNSKNPKNPNNPNNPENPKNLTTPITLITRRQWACVSLRLHAGCECFYEEHHAFGYSYAAQGALEKSYTLMG